VGKTCFEVFTEFSVDPAQLFSLAPKSFHFAACFFHLSCSHSLGVFCSFEVFGQCVISECFSLCRFLGVLCFGAILVVQQSDLIEGLLQIGQLFLRSLDGEF